MRVRLSLDSPIKEDLLEAVKTRKDNGWLKLLALSGKLAKTFSALKVVLFGGSILAYSILFTWQFAILIVISIFIHENGHLWAMKRYGIPVHGIYMIPFLGGVAMAKAAFSSHKSEVYIALMGPIWGLITAFILVISFLITGQAIWAACAGWVAFINVFNLLPLYPLDGGRVMKCITLSMPNWVGIFYMLAMFVLAVGLVVKLGLWLLVLVFALGAMDIIFDFANNKLDRKFGYSVPRYANLTWRQILVSFSSYASLVTILLVTMFLMYNQPGAHLALKLLQ